MPLIKPPVLPPWAEAGDKIQPSNAELQAGWPLSNTPPSRQRMNWVKNYLMNGVRYLSRRGVPDYDAAEIYMIGDRTLAANGKTYRCKLDNTINKEPSANAAEWELWGYTKPELDTAIKAAGMQASGVSVISATGAVSASGAGSSIILGAAGASTITLPLLADCKTGDRFEFINLGTGTATISRAGANDIAVNGGARIVSMNVLPGDTLTLEKYDSGAGVAYWVAIAGSAQLGYAGQFGASTGTNGYQKLPSGMIFQWGVNSVPNGSTADVALPIAFPTVALLAIGNVSNPNSNAFGHASLISTSTVRLSAVASNTLVTESVSWWAIGR